MVAVRAADQPAAASHGHGTGKRGSAAETEPGCALLAVHTPRVLHGRPAKRNVRFALCRHRWPPSLPMPSVESATERTRPAKAGGLSPRWTSRTRRHASGGIEPARTTRDRLLPAVAEVDEFQPADRPMNEHSARLHVSGDLPDVQVVSNTQGEAVCSLVEQLERRGRSSRSLGIGKVQPQRGTTVGSPLQSAGPGGGPIGSSRHPGVPRPSGAPPVVHRTADWCAIGTAVDPDGDEIDMNEWNPYVEAPARNE